jgi:signal recognition particle GTPase
MGNIPGMPAEMMAGTEQEGTRRIRRMMSIMDSMTDQGKAIVIIMHPYAHAHVHDRVGW